NGLIALDYDPSNPYLTVEAHGVFDSIYLNDVLPRKERRSSALLLIEALLEQDYLGALFVNESRLGKIRGALSMRRITPSGRLNGREPDIVVAFTSVSDGCDRPIACVAVIADTPLAEGEGIPNSFSRAGTWTFMAARGPDFQERLTDRAPASIADIA